MKIIFSALAGLLPRRLATTGFTRIRTPSSVVSITSSTRPSKLWMRQEAEMRMLEEERQKEEEERKKEMRQKNSTPGVVAIPAVVGGAVASEKKTCDSNTSGKGRRICFLAVLLYSTLIMLSFNQFKTCFLLRHKYPLQVALRIAGSSIIHSPLSCTVLGRLSCWTHALG